jgi:TonB family protein
MKMNKLFLAAALAGGLLSTSAFATTTHAHGRMNAAIKFEAPVPIRTADPIELPERHPGSSVKLTMTIDEFGRARNVRVASTNDQSAYRQLLDTVSQWQFTPARKDGKAVSARIELPLEVKGA